MTFLVEDEQNGIEKRRISKAANFIKDSKNTVVLTGAGMSTESGILDFRSNTGMYTKIPGDFLSVSNFKKHPTEVYDFFKENLYVVDKEPNIGHKILAEWEGKGLVSLIITQNIDELHQKAGSKNVLEVHGTAQSATCQICGKKYPMGEILNSKNYYCDCDKKGLIKPDIVFFGDQVSAFPEAKRLVRHADLFIVLGTSLQVQPIASLVDKTKYGAHIIIINRDPTPFDDYYYVTPIHSGIGDILSEINKIIKEDK
jgi:NAD-dependent deacetylase